MERNTLSKALYVWESILWSIIAFILYKKIFFIQLSAKSVLESNLILIVMIIITFEANLFLTMRWGRNSIAAVTAAFIPYGVYAYLTFAKYIPKYRIVLFIAAGICVLLLICIFAIKMNEETMRSLVLKKLKMAYSALRLVGAIASIAFMICVICEAHINGNLATPDEETTETYGEQYTIEANIDTVLLLQVEEWEKLSVEERMNVLQCVCNIEGNFLGLNHGVQIIATKLDDNDLGVYNESESTIKISNDLVNSKYVMEALETVCHEMFHAAQWEYVGIYEGLDDAEKKLYFFSPAAAYAEEFYNYQKAEQGKDESTYLEYSQQLCEESARDYAYEAVFDYYNRIDQYLEENTNSLEE